jgi:hypothetical protein
MTMPTITASDIGAIGANGRSRRHGSSRRRPDLLQTLLKPDRSDRKVMRCDSRRAAFDELYESYRYEIS